MTKKLPRWEDINHANRHYLMRFQVLENDGRVVRHMAMSGELGDEARHIVMAHYEAMRKELLKALAPLELDMRVAREAEKKGYKEAAKTMDFPVHQLHQRDGDLLVQRGKKIEQPMLDKLHQETLDLTKQIAKEKNIPIFGAKQVAVDTETTGLDSGRNITTQGHAPEASPKNYVISYDSPNGHGRRAYYCERDGTKVLGVYGESSAKRVDYHQAILEMGVMRNSGYGGVKIEISSDATPKPVDYAELEMRVLAHFGMDMVKTGRFNASSQNFANMYGVPQEQKDDPRHFFVYCRDEEDLADKYLSFDAVKGWQWLYDSLAATLMTQKEAANHANFAGRGKYVGRLPAHKVQAKEQKEDCIVHVKTAEGTTKYLRRMVDYTYSWQETEAAATRFPEPEAMQLMDRYSGSWYVRTRKEELKEFVVLRSRGDKNLYARYLGHGMYEWTEDKKEAALFTLKDADVFVKDYAYGGAQVVPVTG